MYSLVHQVDVARDPTLNVLSLFTVGSSYTRQKLIRKLIFVILFRRIYHNSWKKFLARYYFKNCSIYWCNVFGGTRLSGTFWLKKTSANEVFFRLRRFDYRCITSEFVIFKMFQYFLYILACFHGCN